VTDRAIALEQALAHADLLRLAQRLAVRTPVDAATPPVRHAAVRHPTVRHAAVAAVFRVVETQPELLFIKRADREGDPWSGHMAFPGGRHEPGDMSLEHTAIRETLEELALDLTAGRVLGRLDALAPRSAELPPIVIRPFVAVVPPDVIFTPSDEVAATFWVPLHALRHDEARAEHVITINGSRAHFPGFRVHEHIVWGLTERIVRQLLPMLAP
jgi:8-oxo-dGTP pyrophosphatase MutT (NUDIX family)